MSENGGAVWYYNDQIAQFPIPRDELKRLYEVIKEHPYLEGYANAPLNAYTIKDTLVDGSLLNRPFSPPPEVVDTLEDIDDTIVKFTAMCIQGQKAEPFFSDMLSRFSPSLDVAIAGPDVIDFCKTNKGIGLKTLADYLNLSSSDVIAFGDNYNDLEMLKYAGTSFMVQTDDPNLRAAAAYLTRDPLKEMENIYIKS